MFPQFGICVGTMLKFFKIHQSGGSILPNKGNDTRFKLQGISGHFYTQKDFKLRLILIKFFLLAIVESSCPVSCCVMMTV